MTTPRIDSEFRALIPGPSPEERQQLTDNLRTDGCRDPLVVWQGVLLDGHTRLPICEAHNIPYQTVEQDCADRDAAKAWIIRNQLGRRNLQPFQRAELALLLEPLVAAEARARMVAGTDPGENSPQGGSRSVRTNAAIGKIAGLSSHTIHRVKAIKQHATEDVKEALRQGKVKIHRAYKQLDLDRKSKPKPKVKHVATPTLSYEDKIRAEVHARNLLVQGEALTLEELAQRWKVHTDIARRYLREAVLSVGVTETGSRFTVKVGMSPLAAFKREMLGVVTKGREEARDAYKGWRMDNVHTVKQSKLLDWIVDELTKPS